MASSVVIPEYKGIFYCLASSAIISKCRETFFREIKKIVFQAFQVPSQNIRNFFGVAFFYLSSWESSLLKFFNLGVRALHFTTYKKKRFFEKI